MVEIQKILDTVQERNLSIKDLKMNEIIPNVIDEVVITISEKRCELSLPLDMTGEKYRKWKKGRGGIFYKDVLKVVENKSCGNYVLLEGNGDRFIARLIEDNEIEAFNVLKLIDGKIKDKAYMKLRNIKKEQSLNTSNRYIEQNDEVIDPIIVIETNHIASNSEGSDNQGKQVSLFN